uniref:Uncharacterized protein n=1 Tax=Timema bartmani TaxID=61472 RepID=A0A7R9I0V2_9NEOP|nr:unnamed protein product [Timema bartmani]
MSSVPLKNEKIVFDQRTKINFRADAMELLSTVFLQKVKIPVLFLVLQLPDNQWKDIRSCIACFILPLMSSNRMKPRSGDWAVTFEFLQEAAITSLSNGSNQFTYYTMEKDPLAVKIEPEDDLENNIQHEGTLEIESQFDISTKSERRLKEVYECQQPEYGQRSTVFSPNKEELEKVLKVELYNNCRTPVYEQNIILLPHFKEEPDVIISSTPHLSPASSRNMQGDQRFIQQAAKFISDCSQS